MSRRQWEAAAAELPIGAVVDDVRDALGTVGRVVLHAPPGAGKTTIVPLALLDEPWCTGRVVVLEPRRLAVRGAATRMAQLCGERPGETVGWRMRQDTRVSATTRVEVVTEGVLTRRLQRDPGLDGVSAVVFDEFHERSLDADLGLALTLDLAQLRDDLRIVVMSATLDTDAVAALLDAPVVSSSGRTHPIEIVYLDPDGGRRGGTTEPLWRRRPHDVAAAVVPGVHRALATSDADVLVFLPGAAEIDRSMAALAGVTGPIDTGDGTGSVPIDLRPLHGSLSPAEQDRAIAPSERGRRKVVLSTAIAETSLTIEGVGAVVDAGLRRAPRFDPTSGMSRLVTLPATRAEADQRAGRAGRLGPGVAIRLWSAGAHAGRLAFPEPEIEIADLAGLALDIAAWGAPAADLRWLTPPPSGHLAAAHDLLEALGAVAVDMASGAGIEAGPDAGVDAGPGAERTVRVTPHGRLLASLPLHPRLAQIAVRASRAGRTELGPEVAAALAEHGLARRGRTDLADRVRAIRRPDDRRRAAAERARRDVRRITNALENQAGIDPGGTGVTADGEPRRPDDALGLVAAFGFPDRVGRARTGQRGAFVLQNGRGAVVAETDPLADSEYLCAVELDGDGTRARIFAGVPLSEADVRAVAGDAVTVVERVAWDDARDDVVAVTEQRWGAVVLGEAPLRDPDPDDVAAALVVGLRRRGLGLLGWDDDARRLRDRLAFLHRYRDQHRGPDWPAVDDETLLDEAESRIVPHLAGARRRRDLARIDPTVILFGALPWSARAEVDRLAPDRLVVPSGNRHRVDYSVDPPVLACKLQELFGSTDTPAVLDGAVPVVLHLLSPAGRPLQVTQDLPSFWSNAYAQVRADMRGRYPKHPWPEDPTTAVPTARTKRR